MNSIVQNLSYLGVTPRGARAILPQQTKILNSCLETISHTFTISYIMFIYCSIELVFYGSKSQPLINLLQ